MHLLDANVLITAKNSYYALDRVSEFWEWLLHMGATHALKIPLEIIEEITGGADDLAQWLGDREHKDALCLQEDVDIELVQHVLAQGYAPDLTDAEIIKIGRAPFLIAYAMVSPDVRKVVTTEVSKPTCQRANCRVPDVCNDVGVQWCDSFTMIGSLNFSTNWRARL